MKKVLSLFLAFVFVIGVFASEPITVKVNAEENIDNWDGYIPISTKEDLNNIRYADFDNEQPKYYLINDICFTEEDFDEGGSFYNNGEGWEPIPYFSGVFDGNGYKIVGLEINCNNNNVSELGETAFIEVNDGIIKNLGFSNCSLNVVADTFIWSFSVIVATNYGTISNCYVDSKSSVDILAYNLSEISFGSICTFNFGVIENCVNEADISVKINEKKYVEGKANFTVAGITAFNYSNVNDCYNIGDIYCETLFSVYNIPTNNREFSVIEFAVSGIVGVQDAFESLGFFEPVTLNCYNKGNIDLKMKDTVGQESFLVSDSIPSCDVSGVVARNSAKIVNCNNEGILKIVQERTDYFIFIGSHKTSLGGISGENSGSIVGCYNNGYLCMRQNWNGYQGGIVGSNIDGSVVEKSANFALIENNDKGSVLGEQTVLGGFVGLNRGVIRNSYNAGNVKRNAGLVMLASFCGSNAEDGIIQNCYNIGQNSGVESFWFGESELKSNGLNAGVVAKNFNKSTIKNTYYLNNADVGVCVGADTAKKCTRTQMQQQSTFKGFDFNNVWTIDKNSDYKYPTLKDYSNFPNSYNESDVIYISTPTAQFKNTTKGILVSWNSVENAESYIVYRSEYNASTKKWSKWASIKSGITDVNYTDTTVKLGTSYKYTVRAVNGDVKSKYNDTKGLKYDVTPTVKVAVASNGVKVSWSTAANATGYTVYRSQYNTSTKKWSGWKNMGTAKADKTSWTDKSVKSGVQYKYTVRAANGKVLSSYNKSGVATMFLAQPTVKIANNAKGVKVAWSKVSGATGYTVYRSEYKNGAWTKWASRGTAKANNSSWVDTKVTSGVQYKYTVRAINGKYKSTYVSSSALLYLAQPVTTVKAVSNGVNVAWTQSEGALGYTVYRSEYNTKTKKWSSWKNMGTAKAEKSNWTDKSAKKGVTYKYTVKAVNGKTASTYKASGTVKR